MIYITVYTTFDTTLANADCLSFSTNLFYLTVLYYSFVL